MLQLIKSFLESGELAIHKDAKGFNVSAKGVVAVGAVVALAWLLLQAFI